LRTTSLSRRLFFVAVIAIALLTGALPALAQNAGVPVHMIVTVEGRRGTQPPSISRDDVLVYEGRDRVPVTAWSPFPANGSGLQLYVLMDNSLGTSLDTRLGELQSFVRKQPDAAEIGVAYMHNGTVQIAQQPTRDHEATAKSIRIPQAFSVGSAYESLVELIKRWPTGAARREIVMVTHGIEPYGPAETSNPFVQQAITAAQRANVPVFTIYAPAAGHWGHTWWRVNWGLTYLSQLADETGGEGYGQSGLVPVSFAAYFDDLTQRLQHQYDLTFQAKPQDKPGMQRVRVTSEIPNVDLVAADQVFVPAGR